MSEALRMATTTGNYLTRNTVVALTGTGDQLVVKADTRRYWLRIVSLQPVVAGTYIYPGPVVPAVVAGVFASLDIESKWKDCPSVTAGDWYAVNGGGGSVLVTECLYVGA